MYHTIGLFSILLLLLLLLMMMMMMTMIFIYLFIFPELHFMQIFKLCKIFMKSQSLFSENIKKKYFKMSSAENFTQYALALTVVMTHDCIHVLLP